MRCKQRGTVVILCLVWTAAAADWPAFRGPNSSGVGADSGLPVEMGPGKNVVWKTPLPPGHSSPVLSGDSIFVTAHEDDKLIVISINRRDGRIQWRREAPRPRRQELHKFNNPASPSVATDGKSVFAFFQDFGLLAYGWDGNQRWQLTLGPFNNPFGMAASPLLVDGRLILNCDAESGSFLIAVDAQNGKVLWRVERPDVSRGFSTPILYSPANGPKQAIVAGSYRLVSYDVTTGKEVWWVNQLTWQLKPTPVLDAERVYVIGWAGGSDEGNQEDVPPFEEALRRFDTGKDGKLSRAEIEAAGIRQDWRQMDLDDDGFVGLRDWNMHRSRRSAVNSVMAVKLGGRGDVTSSNIVWRYTRSLPNVPSPLLYQGVLYMLKEGGILTALHPATGKVLKQARLTGALDQYFASPVAADSKIYALSQAGHLVVLRAGADWEILAVNNFDDECYATPALVDGRVYVRTRGALYAFAEQAATQ